jgi:hypothetical protein
VIIADQFLEDDSESGKEVVENDSIDVPELTFTKSDSPTQTLALKMQKWMKKLLGGPPYKSLILLNADI